MALLNAAVKKTQKKTKNGHAMDCGYLELHSRHHLCQMKAVFNEPLTSDWPSWLVIKGRVVKLHQIFGL